MLHSSLNKNQFYFIYCIPYLDAPRDMQGHIRSVMSWLNGTNLAYRLQDRKRNGKNLAYRLQDRNRIGNGSPLSTNSQEGCKRTASITPGRQRI
jgi:hypothetical protein